MVGNRLEKPIEGMEGVTGKGSWHDPLMMQLMDVFVDRRVMQPTVDPIDATVSKGQKEEYGKGKVERATIRNICVQLGVSLNFCEEDEGSWNGHNRN